MKNIHAQNLGKIGGKASVKKRFHGKSKKEISDIMRKVRFKNDTDNLNNNPQLAKDIIDWTEKATGKKLK